METISGSLEETEEADEVRSDVLQVPRYPGGYKRTPHDGQIPSKGLPAGKTRISMVKL